MSFSSTNINAHNYNNNNDNMANSSPDFVSADVNKVLDKSTTVQVIKQDSDEDPMEVTVLRKKLVKQEEAETEDPELESSTTTTVDLPSTHRKLPAELNSQIFLCFNPATQRKFISGLNWDFYAMFRHRLLTKSKRVRNPRGNLWNGTNTRATVAADGLSVSTKMGFPHVLTELPFPISGPLCRVDQFPGTILYYYEIKSKGLWASVGFSDGAIPDDDNLWEGQFLNSFAIQTGLVHYECWLAGVTHHFELPEGVIQPRQKRNGSNVYGCGIVLDPEDKLWIFFTLNGQLLESVSSTINLASRRPLPLELNCEIFKCLKLPIQKKFIWGLGRGIYRIFGQNLLIKTKRLRNPKRNNWDRTRSRRVNVTDTGTGSHTHVPKSVYAMKGFPISAELSRKDNYPGTILYYFEITLLDHRLVLLGLSDKSTPNGDDALIFAGRNYYMNNGYFCYIDGKPHHYNLPGAWQVNVNGPNVQGCGLVMDPNDKLAIFFTLNGKLKVKPIPICPSVDVDRLFPSVHLWNCIIEANFGDDAEGEPFEYDTENCPGLGLACICEEMLAKITL